MKEIEFLWTSLCKMSVKRVISMCFSFLVSWTGFAGICQRGACRWQRNRNQDWSLCKWRFVKKPCELLPVTRRLVCVARHAIGSLFSLCSKRMCARRVHHASWCKTSRWTKTLLHKLFHSGKVYVCLSEAPYSLWTCMTVVRKRPEIRWGPEKRPKIRMGKDIGLNYDHCLQSSRLLIVSLEEFCLSSCCWCHWSSCRYRLLNF